MIDKIIDELANDYMKCAKNAKKEEVIKVLNDAKYILQNNKDKTPEEIINIIIEGCVKDLNNIMNEYKIPGIMSSIEIDNININIYGGLTRTNGEPLTKKSLFDVSSITKLYTELLAYKLINEGVFVLDEKIQDIDPRFKNIGNVTVEDILRFSSKFQTSCLIENTKTKTNAQNKLYNTEVTGLGKYNYNDIGMMILKEVMEYLENKTFEELLNEYILKPYNLNNTYLTVPKDKLHLVTGTPNIDGSVNDLKANVLGGFSGHAGIRVSSNDLIKLSSEINKEYLLRKGLYIPHKYNSLRSNKMGNLYINDGREESYFGRLAPKKSIAAQGSTRVITRASLFKNIDINSTILTNAASMTDESLFNAIQKENKKRLEIGKKLLIPSDLIKEREYDSKTYKMHDVRCIVPESQVIDKMSFKYDNEINLKLLLLNKILKEYDHYDKDITIDRDITNENKIR